MVTVNFFEEDQEKEVFIPAPWRSEPFSRDILYPFHVYGR